MSVWYIIAGGPSFKEVAEKEWKFLENKDTISIARVPYGSRKTKYYLSIEHILADKSIIKYMSKIGWHDIKLLLLNTEAIKYARELGFKSIRKVMKNTFYFMPSRKPWFIDEEHPPHSFYECRAKNFHQPLFRFRGQLIASINAAIILGATEIRLIAVDLNNQWNFYEDFDYLEICCKDRETIDEFKDYMKSKRATTRLKEKKKFNPNYNPKKMHTTNMPYYERERWGDKQLRGVSDVLRWIDKEMREEGMEGIFISNKSSLLFKDKKLRYKPITSE